MKKLRILLIAIIVLFAFTIQIFATSAPSNDNSSMQIPTNKLDYSSRYIFSMKDTSGMLHKVYIVPLKEYTVNNWIWANPVDKVVRGEYAVFLSSANNIATAQTTYLFGAFGKNSSEGIFNLTKSSFQNRAFVVSNQNNNLDILFVAQQVTGSGDASIRAFYVDSGVLKIIHWKNRDGQLLNASFSDGFHPISFNDTGDVIIPGWSRNIEYSGGILSLWEFSPIQQAFVFKETHHTQYE